MKNLLDRGLLEEQYYWPVNIGTTRPRKISYSIKAGPDDHSKCKIKKHTSFLFVLSLLGVLTIVEVDLRSIPAFGIMDGLHPSQSL